MASPLSSRHDGPDLGVFDAPPVFAGGIDVQCPVCGEHSPPTWDGFGTSVLGEYLSALPIKGRGKNDLFNVVALEWMRCSNEKCEELIVRIHEQRVTGTLPGGAPLMNTQTWIARPRFGEAVRSIDPVVPEPFRTDYAEAAAILEASPRMSAVLSRSILADLLKRYAGKTQFGLNARIEAFVKDGGHPTRLTENLQHFREIADFGAHTQEARQEEDDVPEIIPVERPEAEWTLDLVDRLFDYFIVAPNRDEEIKQRMDEKIERAGRKPLRPSASTEDDES